MRWPWQRERFDLPLTYRKGAQMIQSPPPPDAEIPEGLLATGDEGGQ